MSVQEEKPEEEKKEKPKRPMVRILEEFKEKTEEIPPELYEMMERLDEDQIVEEMKGLKPETMIYQFTVAGREVKGLSYAGVREAARRMGYLELFDLKVEDKGEHWYATVRGRDKIRDITIYGVSHQPKKIKLRDGTEQEDPFAYVKCANKACRNALRALLPEKVVNETIEYFLEMARMPKPPTAEKPPSPPPPKPEIPVRFSREEAEPIEVRFLKDAPTLIDVVTMQHLGPFKAEDIARIPRISVQPLIKAGVCVEIKPGKTSKPETKPERVEKVKLSVGEAEIRETMEGVEVNFNPPIPKPQHPYDTIHTFLIPKFLEANRLDYELKEGYDPEKGRETYEGFKVKGRLEEKLWRRLTSIVKWVGEKNLGRG